jgi:serine/threonine protein kinase
MDGSFIYIFMEYVSGGSLQSILKRYQFLTMSAPKIKDTNSVLNPILHYIIKHYCSIRNKHISQHIASTF